MVLEHHQHIETAFAAATRVAAQKKLGLILTGHSNAEESGLYPALTVVNEKDKPAWLIRSRQ